MTARFVEQRTVDPADLDPYPGNPNIGDVDAIRASLRANGQYRAPVARLLPSGRLQVLAGHATRTAATAEAMQLRVDVIEADDATARRIVLADNRTAQLASYDEVLLLNLLREAEDDLTGTGWDAGWDDGYLRRLLDGPPQTLAGGAPAGPAPTLADRFLIPPFDVLNAREGWWGDRKRQWLSLGIKSEVGRSGSEPGSSGKQSHSGAWLARGPGGDIAPYDEKYRDPPVEGLIYGKSASGRDPAFYAKKNAAEARLGRTLTRAEFEEEHYDGGTAEGGITATGTSVFDPVLCELAYRWFSAPGHAVLDPFAGGSVRGLVAAVLGRTYLGNDLRAEQIDANLEQRTHFETRSLIPPGAVDWTVGDSQHWVQTLTANSADLLFTCPPYLWLERYSDDPADLSNATQADFETAYTAILTGAVRALRTDRYAVIVVGDVRDNRGRLVDFRGMTVRAAETAGLMYQSGAVLVTPVGSLPVRAARGFLGTRVLGRTHQDVLVFVKGTPGAAARACGDVDLSALPEQDANPGEDQ